MDFEEGDTSQPNWFLIDVQYITGTAPEPWVSLLVIVMKNAMQLLTCMLIACMAR